MILKKYWKYHGKFDPIPLRRYVNNGLVAGKVKNLLKFYSYLVDNDFKDDELGLANYVNVYPERVFVDYNAKILNTSGFGVNEGLYDMEKQCQDSSTFAELVGMSSYFLHIPVANMIKGQNYIYTLIYIIIDNNVIKQPHSMFNLFSLNPSTNPYLKCCITTEDTINSL